MKTTTSSTRISRTSTFDRMAIKATLASGEVIKFAVSRSRESLAYTPAAGTTPPTRDQFKKIQAYTGFRPQEKNVDRFDRLEKLFRECLTIEDILIKISSQLVNKLLRVETDPFQILDILGGDPGNSYREALDRSEGFHCITFSENNWNAACQMLEQA